MRNPVDEMIILDVLGNTCNVLKNRNWLFDNHFHEIFSLENGDHANRVFSNGFERNFNFNNETFTITVDIQENCCVAYIKEFYHLCSLLKNKYDDKELWEKARWGSCFTGNTAEEAVGNAIIYGVEFIKKVYDLMSNNNRYKHA